MDNKFISEKLFTLYSNLYFRRDPMVQQEPSYWLMKSEPVCLSLGSQGLIIFYPNFTQTFLLIQS